MYSDLPRTVDQHHGLCSAEGHRVFNWTDARSLYFDVIGGPIRRANIVVPSVADGPRAVVRIALTDACHCPPAAGAIELQLHGEPVVYRSGEVTTSTVPAARLSRLTGGAREWAGLST